LTNKDFVANNASKNKNKNKKPICKHCKKIGYIIDKCWILHPELQTSKDNEGKNKGNKSNDNKSKNESTKGVITSLAYNLEDLTLENNKAGYIAPELILNSGASKHYTYNKN